jgi:hypothetical protein
MKVKQLLIIDAIILFVFGIGFLFAPGRILQCLQFGFSSRGG